MGAGASLAAPKKKLQGRRYLQGMIPEKYFAEVVQAEHGETFRVLGLNDYEGLQLFLQFVILDKDNDGQVALDDFHTYLEVRPTKFSERVFTMLDLDGSGQLDFHEFLAGVWNYCTYDASLVARLVFDIFDCDRLRKLTVPELDAMIRMLYGTENADSGLLKLVSPRGNSDYDYITLEEFTAVICNHVEVLQPAFELQRSLRKRMLGVVTWEAKTKTRKETFAGMDQGELKSWEAIEAILTLKQRERDEQAAKLKEEQERKIENEHKKAEEEKEQYMNDIRSQNMAKLARLQQTKPEHEVLEEAAWDELRQAKDAMELEKWTIEDLSRLRETRVRLWKAVNAAIDLSNAAALSVHQKRYDLAVGQDAQHKADAWISGATGQRRFDVRVRRAYGDLLRAQYAKGNPAERYLAQLLDEPRVSPRGGTSGISKVPLALRWAWSHPQKGLKETAKVVAREAIVQKFASQDGGALQGAYNEEVKQRNLDFTKLRDDIRERYGSANTMWERLWSPTDNVHYLWHVTKEERLSSAYAICEKCDTAIDPEDYICPGCQAGRSATNMDLYRKPGAPRQGL